MSMKLVFGFILFIGIVSFWGYVTDQQEIAKAANWPIVNATLIDIQDKSFSIPILSRFIPIRFPHAKYSYRVDGKEYQGEKTSGPTIAYVRMATFKKPEMDKPDTTEFIKSLRENKTIDFSSLIAGIKFKPIKVHYEAAHPENSMPDPDVMQSAPSLWWSTMFLVGLGGLGLAALYYHDYTVKPVDDPMLSLDGALAAQKRRRS